MRTDNVRLVKELRALANGRQDDDTTITPVVMEAALRIEEQASTIGQQRDCIERLEKKDREFLGVVTHSLEAQKHLKEALECALDNAIKDYISVGDAHTIALAMNEVI